MTNITIGSIVNIPVGTRVTRLGVTSKRTSRTTTVTVRDVKTTRGGNVRVFWKSNGYRASAIIGA